MSSYFFIVVILSIAFGLISSILMIVAVAADFWEVIVFNKDQFKHMSNIIMDQSYFDDDNGFYKVVLSEYIDGNLTTHTLYLRDMNGGIWKICDRVKDSFKNTDLYKTALAEKDYLKYDCFDYIHQLEDRRDSLDENGKYLIRMQNSASSCNIVCLMCLLTAAITGMFSLIQKQVTAVMVTGVMYIVAGVFLCFALVIMQTKIRYMKEDCYTLDPMGLSLESEVCQARKVSLGWCIAVAWSCFPLLLLAFICWLFLARYLRAEKAKSII